MSDELQERHYYLTLKNCEVVGRAPLLKEVPGGPQALLVDLLADHLYYLLFKAQWEKPGHLQTGERTKRPISASDWTLGLEAQSGTDMFRFSRVYKY